MRLEVLGRPDLIFVSPDFYYHVSCQAVLVGELKFYANSNQWLPGNDCDILVCNPSEITLCYVNMIAVSAEALNVTAADTRWRCCSVDMESLIEPILQIMCANMCSVQSLVLWEFELYNEYDESMQQRLLVPAEGFNRSLLAVLRNTCLMFLFFVQTREASSLCVM